MATDNSFESFELVPADYSFPMFYAGGTISFQLKSPETGVPILETAIERLTAHLPFLTGVVMPSGDKPGVMEVRPAPCRQVISDTDTPLCITQSLPHLRLASGSDPLRRKGPGAYNRNASLLLAPVQVAASSASHPVIRFQINVLADGIILALFFNHMVIDGTGIGTLIESLAACCRAGLPGDGVLNLPSDAACEKGTRKFLASLDRASHGRTIQANPVESAVSTGHEEVHDASLVDYNFRLSAEKIQRLRQHAQRMQLKTQQPGQTSVSEDDIVTAVLWICLGRFRFHPADGKTGSTCTLQRVVNVRPRLRPQVPAGYLGNCFVMLNEPQSTTELGAADSSEPRTEGEYASEIARIANELRARLDEVDDEFVRGYLSQFSGANDWAKTAVHEPDVAVTSIRRLPVYGQIFGDVLGEVVNFEMLPYMNPEGVCTLKPRRNADQAWYVGVTLGSEDMDRLRNHAMFSWLVEWESPLRIVEPKP